MTDLEKAIVMAYTGCTMLAGDKLGIYYQYVQEKLGRSVWTHELAYKEVQDAIKEAAKEDFIALAKADDGWISVKDRLPNNQNPVIVAVPPHTDAEGEEYSGYVGMAYYTYFPNGGMWCGTDGDVYGAIGEIATPTHWMELPELPDEEREKAKWET